MGAALTPRAGSASVDQSRWPWIAAVLAVLGLILALNPVGYLGGGLDDWRYLEAARCWVARGPCLPDNHWAGRWPLVAAIAASIATFGETRFSVGLPSLLYASACLALLASIGNRLFGAPVGAIAALLLLGVPAFAVELIDPNAGSAELFFLLLAATFLIRYTDGRRRWQAFVAALAWAMACQVRETALFGVVPLALVVWRCSARDRGALLAAAAGAALPFALEAMLFWSQTGDPLFRRRLSVGHTLIASSELSGPVSTRPPFFNPAFIANWRHEPGLQLHWAIDGLLNLLFNLKAGVLLATTAVIAALFTRRLERIDRRAIGICLALALLWAAGLIYALAIDPKPRMMLVPLTASALALAALLDRLARAGSYALTGVAGAVTLVAGLSVAISHPQIYSSETVIADWARRHPGQIMVDPTARTHLALVPAARDFAGLASERPFLLMRFDDQCRAVRPTPSRALYRPVGRSSLDPFGRAGHEQFCLLRRTDPVSTTLPKMAAS